jgi:hypothetical protein
MPKDGGRRWKRSRALQYVFKRKFIVSCECNPICEAPRVPADFLQPKFLVGRIAVHHCLVSGKTRRIFSKTAGKLFATAPTVSFSVRVEYRMRRCSTAVNTIGVAAKRSCRWRWTKATAGAPKLTIRSGRRWYGGHADTRRKELLSLHRWNRQSLRMVADFQRPS